MTEQKQIYKCEVCGNVVEVLNAGIGELVCCGQPMNLQQEKNKDEGLEKHVPVIEKTDSGTKVKVGSTEHPMDEDHYIQWIEVTAGGKDLKKFLKPGDKPEFEICSQEEEVSARAYCNVHGLWKS